MALSERRFPFCQIGQNRGGWQNAVAVEIYLLAIDCKRLKIILGHFKHAFAHAIAWFCADNAFFWHLLILWRPREDAENAPFIQQKQCEARDTSSLCGPMAVNGLAVELGHGFDGVATKNSGALAGATGAQFETSSIDQTYIFRAVCAIVEAAESGDADACNMARRALERLPADLLATGAMVFLSALDDDSAEHVVNSTVRTMGFPLFDRVAPLPGARWCMAQASLAEAKAYHVASYEKFTPEQRADCRRWHDEFDAANREAAS